MFGFSITKLLFTAAVIAAVWYGFKMLTRLGDRKSERISRGGNKASKKSAKAANAASEDMVECAVCGIFVSAAAGSCERSDCPY